MTDTFQTAPGLTDEQVQLFWKQGFIHGIPVLSATQASTARKKFEALETQAAVDAGDRWTDPDYSPWNKHNHPIQMWCRAMSTHPRVLAAVSAILGPDVLIRNADVFIKEPGVTRRIKWHVDTTAPLESARLMVTAWLGLTASTVENGCMDFIPGSHLEALPPSAVDRNSLTFRGTALEALDQQSGFANEMPIGHLSLHCFRTVHRSNGNTSGDRRFGYVTRFVSPQANPKAAECGMAYLATGENKPANLTLQKTFPISWTHRGARRQP